MADSSFDVVVVGAGPAGLLASETLAQQGIKVAVIERDQNPGKDKPCGGFLTTQGMTEGKIPVEIAERTTNGVSITMPGFPIRHIDYPHAIGIQLTRKELGRYLSQRAETAGATLLLQHQVIGCKRDNSTWHITLKGKVKDLQTSLLIGADGVNSTVARETGLRTRFNRDELGITIQAQIALPEEVISNRFGNRMEFYYGREFCPYGYLWIFPKHSSVYVGVGSLLSVVTNRLELYLNRFIETHSMGKEKLAEGTIQLIERALVPLTYQRKSAADGVLLVGDAAGHCSAITGEGLHYSIAAGRIAGEIAVNAVKKGSFGYQFLRRYEQRWNRAFGSDLKWGLRLRNYFYRGMVSQSVSSGISSNRRFLLLAADLITGVRPYRDTIIRALPYYLWNRIKMAFRPKSQN